MAQQPLSLRRRYSNPLLSINVKSEFNDKYKVRRLLFLVVIYKML